MGAITIMQHKQLLQSDLFLKKLEDVMGKKADGFVSSVLQVVGNNKLLASADPKTVMNAAMMAATLNLPINNNLGFAWIVPYGGQAQFQLGWKGFVQLAQRTGQYKRINVQPVYENQFTSYNKLYEELDADFNIVGEGKVVGYVAYFKLINGFEKLNYWSLEEVQAHAKRYSQTYGKKSRSGKLFHSPWNDKDQFDSMAMKTVLKNTLNKWGILSIEMEKAMLGDQSVQVEEDSFTYPDNEPTTAYNDEEQRVVDAMQKDIDSELDLIDFEEKYRKAVDTLGNDSIINMFTAHLMGDNATTEDNG